MWIAEYAPNDDDDTNSDTCSSINRSPTTPEGPDQNSGWVLAMRWVWGILLETLNIAGLFLWVLVRPLI